MEVQPPGFPVAIKTASISLGSEPCDLICSTYLDGTVLLASQLGTVGTVILAKQDATFEGKTTFSTTVLVGKRDEPLLTVAARQLVELAHSRGGLTKPLICCLALKHHTPECIKELLAAVQHHNVL